MSTPLKAVHCAFVVPFHILDAKVRQKVARRKKKCSKKVNESTSQQVNEFFWGEGLMGVFCFRTHRTHQTHQTHLLSDLSDFNSLTC